ncbi:MAG: tetratricopeptide repeat protein, partial [Leptolyngbyaceae cyanobacterium MO_188.B28]|nr:tetratricopeptide repeat protein [Leptolyngbyaceae cyanobacterium MO_188.B28]
MDPKKRPSRQDLNRERQRSAFVGRVEQLETFQHNLTHLQQTEDGFEYPNDFLFNVWGQGGVGKTTLLRQFEDITKRCQGIVAYVDEAIPTVPEAMAEFAKQLSGQGLTLAKFSERYKVYRQKREELEADPEAPQGFSAFMGKTVARVGLKLGRQTPIAGAAIDFIDEDSLVEGVGEWAAYVTRKLKNKDEIQLVNEPIKVLTPLFLENLGAITDRQIVLLFDTYERTGEILEPWLLDILAGRYGDLPPNCIWVIAGRNSLKLNDWSYYEPVQFPLEPFTPEEAVQFLQRKNVTNAQVINSILDVSGRLPLLLAILAENSPNDPALVGEASGTAVERFLKWVDDPAKRQLALDAALPQSLNRDVITHLVEDSNGDVLFSWLKTMPFVRERSDGWAYHDVVRPQMLRCQQRESVQHWAEKHRSLAKYYDGCCQQLQLDETACYADAAWRNFALQRLYHRLCSHPQKGLPVALNQFLDALKQKHSFAQQWGAILRQAGQELEVKALQDWGERLAKGLKAYEDDDYSEMLAALTALLKAVDIAKEKHSIIYARRGELYSLKPDYKKALEDLNRAIELDPDYQWAITGRGITYQSMERYDEALADLNRAIELDPDYQWAITGRGVTYRLMKRYDEALADFNRVIELDPEDQWAITGRGVTYRLMERYDEALADYNRAIELDPKYDWAIANRGVTYRLMKRYDEALADYNRAIELDPEDKLAIKSRGVTYRLMKRYDEALADFNRAIELDPEDKSAIKSRGETHHLMKRYDEALADFNRAIELDPEDQWAIANRGLTYRLMERYDEALADYNRAIELDPKYDWAIANRGITYRLMERYEEGLVDFNRAIELDPEDQWAIANRGVTYRLMERYEESLTDYNRAIELDPEDQWAITGRGETHRLMERYEKALVDLNRAIELDPEDQWAIKSRGITYCSMERYEESLTDLNRAIELDPEDQWAIKSRGITYCSMERY